MPDDRAQILPIREVLSTTIVTTSVSTILYAIPPPPGITTYLPSTSTTVETIVTTTEVPNSSAVTGTTSIASPPNSSTSSGSTAPKSTGGGGNKVGAGAVAGIAIACFLVGAAIGCLLIFLIISRRKWRRSGRQVNDGMDSRNGSTGMPEKGLASTTISIPQGSSAAVVQNNLPQPVEDNAIKTELSKLKDRVSDHIQSYYDLAKIEIPVASQDLHQVLANNSPVSFEKFSNLLADPRTRPAILRYGLAWVILSRVSLDCDPSISFLPWHVVGCLHDMVLSKLNDSDRTAMLSKWRCITSTLLQSTYGQPTTIEADPRNESVRKAVQVADIILRPYVDERVDNAARLRNLEEIMRRAMRFAYMLFSHPSSWHFDWQEADEHVVVFPALLQLTDEEGAFLKSPRIFSEKVVMKA